MAISVNSEDFRDTIKELNSLAKEKKLNKNVATEIITSKGYDPLEFKNTYKEFTTLSKEERE